MDLPGHFSAPTHTSAPGASFGSHSSRGAKSKKKKGFSLFNRSERKAVDEDDDLEECDFDMDNADTRKTASWSLESNTIQVEQSRRMVSKAVMMNKSKFSSKK